MFNFQTKGQGKIVEPPYNAEEYYEADVVEKEGGFVKIVNKPPEFDRVEFDNMVLAPFDLNQVI